MDFITKKITQRIENGQLRNLTDYTNKIDFFSNDYLGFSKIPLNSNKNHGSTGSRLISGNSNFITRTEQEFADFFQQESSLFFNSGYDANVGLFSAILSRNDVIFFDEYIHASIRDGIRLSNSRSYHFKHNDLEDLKQKLKKNTRTTTYVVVESIYSMEGDISPLNDICELCQIYDVKLIVDEAHSVGVYGVYGKGLVSELNLDDFIFAKIITYGKSFGLHGASVLGNKILIQFLSNFSRPFIYTTAPSEFHIDILKKRLVQISKADLERSKLKENITQFSSLFNFKKSTLIFNFEIGEVEKTKKLSEKLLREKIAVKPIYSPTVPKGKERLRICLHSFNSKKEIQRLYAILNESIILLNPRNH